MKIKKVSTKQFAGIRGREIELHNGINVIYGKNETGKSTFVDLILGLLFQNVKINARTDKLFKENAFPAARADGDSSGDKIDGTVVLETEDGNYTLQKKWLRNSAGSADLSAPKADFGTQSEVTEILNGVLGYGEGVYREILFSPQSSAADNLKAILEAESSRSVKTLTDKITSAFAECGGISIDALEKEIDGIISELTGKQWSIEKMAPIHINYREKTNSRGSIIDALVKWDDYKEAVLHFENLENIFDEAKKALEAAEDEANNAKNKLNEFEKYYNTLQMLAENNNKKAQEEANLKRYEKALADYPKNKLDSERALKLKAELENRALLDRYDSVKKCADKLDKIQEELNKLKRPDDPEIQSVRDAEAKITKLKNSLCKMNIAAKIKTVSGYPVKIYSLVTGEEIHFNDDTANIKEAVRAEIPGVMEMELVPADVDAENVNAEISRLNDLKNAALEKYGCNDTESLKKLADNYDELLKKIEFSKEEFDRAAESENIEELKKRAEAAGNVREKTDIESDIHKLCGTGEIDRFIGGRQADIDSFEREFKSEENLRETIKVCLSNIKKAEDAIRTAENIPEEYKNISDPEQYRKSLQNAVDKAQDQEKSAIDARAEAKTELYKFTEENGDDLREKCENAEEKYNEQVDLLKSWLHIQELFVKRKKELFSEPFTDIAQNFAENLKIISGGNVSAELFNEEKLEFSLMSGDFRTDAAKMSNGTKDTVYLAFRLAALDHLFPDGGVIILDDPLNDMDIDRVKRSCELIKKCAERHQVILLTCRGEYADILGEKALSW